MQMAAQRHASFASEAATTTTATTTVKTFKGLAARTCNQRELVACCQVSQWSLLKAKTNENASERERKSG